MASVSGQDTPTDWTVYEWPETPPPQEPLEQVAHRLRSYKDDTPLRILHALTTGPKRFKELQEVTGKPDGQLTRALSTLHDEGLLVERMQAEEKPATKAHDLAPKGMFVLELLERFHEAAEGEPFEVRTPEHTYVLYSERIQEGGGWKRRYFFVEKGTEQGDASPSPLPSDSRVVITADGTPLLDKE